jgi:sortase A
MSTIENQDGRYLVVIRRETKTQRRWWQAVLWLERICLTCGLGLLAFVGVARLERSIGSQAALKAFADLDSSASLSDSSAPSAHPEAVDRLTDRAVHRSANEVVPANMEQVVRRSAVPLAVLEIPKIHLEAPVLNGTDAVTLNHAVGRIAGTARLGEPGNIGIAGHRDTFFRGLKDLQRGDTIKLKTRERTDTYIVDEIQIVTPQDVRVLGPRAHPSLTLVTCYPFYFVGNAPQRYIVMASLTGERRSGPGQSVQSPKS